jgi:polar amino acid transport system substrate-binding protein
MWIFVGIIMIAQLQATVTSALTVRALTGSIHGPADLPGKRVAAVAGTTSAAYLANEQIAYTPTTRIDEAIALLEDHQVQAVVYDAPVLRYLAETTSKGKLEIAGSPFRQERYAIALPRDSALRKTINETILNLREDGTYDALAARWFGNDPNDS